jgi:hypothetical protein
VNTTTIKIEEREFLQAISHATSRNDLWKHVLQVAHVATMAEVGVWRGDFARQILEGCDAIQRYYMVDPWANLPNWNKPFNISSKEFDEVYEEALKNTEFASAKIVVLRGETKNVVDKIPDSSLDFAYIDGDHTLRGITIDLISLLPKIKNGGLIGGDDFTSTPWQHGIRYEPTLVCPFSIYFAEAMSLPIIALPFNQFLIQKRSDSAFSFVDLTGRYKDISLNKLPSGIIKTAIGRKLKRLFGR